jgi:hypothetical protein
MPRLVLKAYISFAATNIGFTMPLYTSNRVSN